MIARTIRLLLTSGFLAAVSHVAPVAERGSAWDHALKTWPEAIARPLGKIRADARRH